MNRLVFAFLFLCSTALAIDYVNTNTWKRVTTLPNPLIVEGLSTFNAKPKDYYDAGWVRVISAAVPKGYNIISTNYMVTMPFKVSNTNGVVVTNYAIPPTRKIAIEQLMLDPIIVEKPSFVQLAEMQYVSIWHNVFGQQNNGYTNAEYQNVVIQITQIAATNPSVLEYTHTMERSFEFIRSWWTNETKLQTFHPYPWGLSTNIVLKDIVNQ